MKIVVAGGTGFLGKPLSDRLATDGHEVVVLTRSASSRPEHAPGSGIPGITRVAWQPDGEAGEWRGSVDGAHAVINLAGESIAGRRWSDAQKARIRDSRLRATRSIIEAIRRSARPPRSLVNASAVGYYGNRGDERLTEDSPPGDDFLSEVCVAWEAEARKAEALGTRVVLVRTGIVLERDGGALKPMLLPFRLFAGGPLGSGRQYMPWIHRLDWLDMVRWLLSDHVPGGPYNATSPEPATNKEFSRALGRALHRPSFVPAPAFALRLALGEMADALLLGGQRALPARALQHGFQFTHLDLDEALREIVR